MAKLVMNPDIQKLLSKLTKLRTDDHRIVTCYLKIEPRDRARGKYLIKLKNRIREVERALDALGLPRAVREEVAADLRRIYDELREPARLPATHGLAVFACGPLKLFELVGLPSVHRSRLAVDRTALVRELASLEDEIGTLLTVVMDRTSARIFEVTAFGAVELEDLRADNTRGGRFHGDRADAPGRGEHTYHNRIREEKHRHFAMIAERLFELHRKRPVHGVVLAGPGKDGGAVAAFLHPYLAERLMGVVSLNPKEAKPAVVYQATLATRAEFERAAERSTAHGLDDALGEGWAVDGIDATLRSLGRGQVRTLLVDADCQGPGFRSGKTGRLATREEELRGQGDVLPVLDVVDDAIEEALRQRVEVDVLQDPAARGAIKGLAGLLRFR
jgi:peptide subunit release factor 1 (eRF1)